MALYLTSVPYVMLQVQKKKNTQKTTQEKNKTARTKATQKK